MPEDVTSEDHFSARPLRVAAEPVKSYMPSSPFNARPDELGRIAFALDRLTDRIEASETRTGLAISGVEHSVRHAMARIETAEREHLAVATRFDAAAEQLAAEQARASERMRWMETELSGPRSTEALKIIEEQVTRVSSQIADGEARSRATLAELEARLANAEAGDDPAGLIDQVVSQLGQRLADAEARTGDALESLAEQLTRKVEDARSEIAERLATASTDGVEARLDRMAEDLAAAEQRSAEAIEQVGGEIARIAGAVENRLGRTDQLHAEALERLGAEIGAITE
ncbi:MAG: Localization factor PodJS, partial [Phenylobacterium sp.]